MAHNTGPQYRPHNTGPTIRVVHYRVYIKCCRCGLQYMYTQLTLGWVTLERERQMVAITSNVHNTVYSVQYTVYSVHYTVYSVQYTVYSVQYAVHSVQYTVYSVQCTVYSVHRTLYIVECTVYQNTYVYNQKYKSVIQIYALHTLYIF